MSIESLLRFSQYAQTFEEVFKDDNWDLLEPFFTEDAVYEIVGDGPTAGRHEGRVAIFAALKKSLDEFDRRFDARTFEILEGPDEHDDGVWMIWRVTYQLAGAPDLVLEGEERVWFDGRRITRLEDKMVAGISMEEITAFMKEHGSKLHPAPGEAS